MFRKNNKRPTFTNSKEAYVMSLGELPQHRHKALSSTSLAIREQGTDPPSRSPQFRGESSLVTKTCPEHHRAQGEVSEASKG